MKIKYDMNKNYFKCYNESQGVILVKGEIINNPNKVIYNYLEKGIIYMLFVILTFIISRFLNFFDNMDNIIKVIDIILYIACGLVALYFIMFFAGYFVEKRRNHSGDLEVDATGIKDLSNTGVIIGFTWDNIKYVVIKKHTINIITDNAIYLCIDASHKDRLLNAINRYNPNLTIIDKTK